MKIEKLSDNQIRCTLNKHDLIDRELKISELAYGSEKAKGLFRDVMNQAFDEFGFEAEDIPLIIEAIPVSGDCIILIVTKVDDPEELDTRFAKFSSLFGDDEEDDDDDDDELALLDTSDSEDEFSAASDIMNLIRKLSDGIVGNDKNLSEHIIPISQKAKESISKAPDKSGEASASVRVFSFASLDEVSTLSRVIHSSFQGQSTLYKDPRTKTYYLSLENRGDSSENFTRILNTATEYGRREKCTYATLAYYDEHYETIIRRKAVSVLASLG